MGKEKINIQLNIPKVNSEIVIKSTPDKRNNLINLIEYQNKGILTNEQAETVQQLKKEISDTKEDQI